MNLKDVIAFCIIAFVLLLTGSLIASGKLWSLFCNTSIPWFASTLALSVVIVGLAGYLAGTKISRIPLVTVIIVYMVSTAVPFFGVLVDGWGRWFTEAFNTSIGEVIGFAVVLFVVFLLPRISGPGEADGGEEDGAGAAN